MMRKGVNRSGAVFRRAVATLSEGKVWRLFNVLQASLERFLLWHAYRNASVSGSLPWERGHIGSIPCGLEARAADERAHPTLSKRKSQISIYDVNW
jgi:hypothetical protein